MTQLVEQAQSIPVDLEEKQAANKNLKFIIGGVLVIALIITLIVQATVSTGAHYLTVTELADRRRASSAKRGVSGAVVDGSEDWNAQRLRCALPSATKTAPSFPLSSMARRITSNGPPLLIVEGELLADGTFQAETLLLKCPSRYEEEPEEVFVEASR